MSKCKYCGDEYVLYHDSQEGICDPCREPVDTSDWNHDTGLGGFMTALMEDLSKGEES